VTDTVPITVTGGGVDFATLVELASEVTVADGNTGELDYHGLADDPAGPFAGMDHVVSEAADVYPFTDQLGDAQAWTTYVGPGYEWIEIRLVDTPPAEQRINDLVLSRPLPEVDYSPGDAETVERLSRTGRPVQLRLTTGGEQRVVARLQLSGTQQLLVTGTVTPTVLLDVIGQVRVAADDEWRNLIATTYNQAYPFSSDPVDQIVLQSDTPLEWYADVTDGRFQLSADDCFFGGPFERGSGPELREFRSMERAFLRATTTWPSDARSIVITQDGREPIAVALFHDSASVQFVGLAEIDADTPYSVQWLDADGAVVDGPSRWAP
jgi:hypothetical protein